MVLDGYWMQSSSKDGNYLRAPNSGLHILYAKELLLLFTVMILCTIKENFKNLLSNNHSSQLFSSLFPFSSYFICERHVVPSVRIIYLSYTCHR
jgi:hypothetical protein